MRFQLFYPDSLKNFNDHEDYNMIVTGLKEKPGSLYEDVGLVQDGQDEDTDVVWKRPREICKKPYFIKGKPSMFDVLQGDLGDCWAIAVVQLLTLKRESFDRVVVPSQDFGENYTGCFHFRFYKLGTWYDVVIDDRLPVNRSTNVPEYVRSKHNDVFWGALLEKALAKFYTQNSNGYEFQSLRTGLMITSFQTLTGGIAFSEKIVSTKQHFRLRNLIEASFMYRGLAAVSTNRSIKGLLSGHSYALIDIKSVTDKRSKYYDVRLVKVMNPWGFEEWIGLWSDNDYIRWWEVDVKIRRELGYESVDDGQFWMTMEDLLKYFRYFHLCHLSPSDFMISRNFYELVYDWNLEVLRGQWVKDVSAGGNSFSRYKNPQYVFTVGTEGEEKVDDCCALIELTMWSKVSRRIKDKVAFYIYDLSSSNDKPPFGSVWFFMNKAMYEKPDFDSSFYRCYLQYHLAELGKRYLLVPCTITANFEAVFTIRIMSHYEIKVLDSSDPEISKASPTETEGTCEIDRELVELFFKVSQGKDEIDWIGLRKILNDVLGESENLISYFISYLFKFVGNMFLPTLSYEESHEESFFSKDECRRMIAMVEDDHSGKLNFSDFSKLWNKISFWTKVYDENKEDEHGLPTRELRDALCASGCNISTHAIHSFSHLYADEQSYITLKDFILCGVTMETVLNLCAAKKREDEIMVFTLQEWIKNTLIL